MRILIADDEICRVLRSQMFEMLTRYGSVDVVQNGRDAVISYVKNGANGVFYDLLVLDQHLDVLNGFAIVEMVRTFESDFRRAGMRTMICVFCSDDAVPQQYEIRHGKDDRTRILCKPVNLAVLESLAGSLGAELEMDNASPVPMPSGRSLGMQKERSTVPYFVEARQHV